MAILPIQCGGYHVPSKLYQPHKPTTAQLRSYPPRIFISTKLVDVNPNHLRDLYSLCNHSCHQFPKLDEPLDILKLRTAIAHSSVVVSVFTDHPDSTGEWVRKLLPVSPENGQLVGFGRAVSDLSLTASIYDVMVHPDLQGRGIGRRIVERIIRMLTNKGIYDIATLTTDTVRPFFSACGFGDDTLGSTTMMYTRAPSGYSKDEQLIRAGRKLLLVPRPRKFINLRSCNQ